MCHNSGTVAQSPAHCRALMVAFVPACPFRWVPGLAWGLLMTSARDCDITKWRCREGAWGPPAEEQPGPQQDGGPQKEQGRCVLGPCKEGCVCLVGVQPAVNQLPERWAPCSWLSSLTSRRFPRSLGSPLETASHRERVGLWALWVRPGRVYLGLGSPALLPRALFLAPRFNQDQG